jgi:hypothetical protein
MMRRGMSPNQPKINLVTVYRLSGTPEQVQEMLFYDSFTAKVLFINRHFIYPCYVMLKEKKEYGCEQLRV